MSRIRGGGGRSIVAVRGRASRRIVLATSVAVAAALAAPAASPHGAAAQTPATLDPLLTATLATAAPTTPIQMVGVLSHTPTATDVTLLDSLGATAVPYTALPMVALQAPAGVVPSLQASGVVTGLWQNRPLELLLHESVPLIGADAVRTQLGYDGHGVGVAILDSGVDGNHPDVHYPDHLVQNVLMLGYTKVFSTLTLTEENVVDTDTTSGHGTHVAGIAGGTGAASGGYYTGVAPGASIIGVGAGQATDMIATTAGLDWIVKNRTRYNIRVVNCSWGDGTITYDPNDPINVGTKAAHDSGITVVMGAGNDGTDALGNPQSGMLNRYAWAPWVIAVGGGDKLGQLASYSSTGDGVHNPTLIAPGSYIASARAITGVVTDANSTPFDLTDPANPRTVPTQWDAYYTVALGTSMSTPHVSGVVALMLQAVPSLTPDQVKQILAATATPMPACPVSACGAGYVNAMAAVQKARMVVDQPPVAALSASPSIGGSPLTVTFDASASYDPDGSVVQYRWDFNGDGVVDSVTTAPTTTHTYGTGAWSPAVSVVDNLGVASTPATATVLVDNPPTAAATVPGKAKYGDTIGFDGRASTDSDGSVAAWLWDFGDGTAGTGAFATHVYTQSVPGRTLFVWKLTVTDNSGRSSTIAGTIKLTP
jgi:serine protease AprX